MKLLPSAPEECPPTRYVLLALALLLFVFGWFYLLDPGGSIGSVDAIAARIGVGTLPPSEPAGYFRGWLGFTFAYMMGATACALLAALLPAERPAYLKVLLVLKGTSSLTGLALFLAADPYGFYLATVVTDGLIFLLVLALFLHHRKVHAGPPGATSARRDGTG